MLGKHSLEHPKLLHLEDLRKKTLFFSILVISGRIFFRWPRWVWLCRYMAQTINQWIGLRENVHRKAPYLMGKSMVSCRFSLQPIHWINNPKIWKQKKKNHANWWFRVQVIDVVGMGQQLKWYSDRYTNAWSFRIWNHWFWLSIILNGG